MATPILLRLMLNIYNSGCRRFSIYWSLVYRKFTGLLLLTCCSALVIVGYSKFNNRSQGRREVLFEFELRSGFTSHEPWKMTIDNNSLAVVYRQSNSSRSWIPCSEIAPFNSEEVHRIWQELPKRGSYFGRLINERPFLVVTVRDPVSKGSWRADIPYDSRGQSGQFGWINDPGMHPFSFTNAISAVEEDRLVSCFRRLAIQYGEIGPKNTRRYPDNSQHK